MQNAKLFFNEVLAPHTSWRIGGPANQYFCPQTNADVSALLRTLPADEQLFWLGLGSNVLIRDGGFPGTVIHTLKMQAKIQILSQDTDGLMINVDAGVPCAKIAKFAAKHFVVGAEFFAGIPGTMGGALAMNAGAFGSETWQHVIAVDVINRQGEIIRRTASDYVVGYRTVVGPSDEWFLGAQLKFVSGDQQQANLRIKELLKRRNDTQPIGLPSCGSVFRNPEGKYAAELIEASKLKGIRVGDAEVSAKHANFIINTGAATARDVETLIQQVQAKVWQDHAVELCPEVRFIGIQ
ncbi:MAG TPA: UDP-N-acetylmuramate dehydrogenase [Gammaproteobacteria bacterium]|nr:UDP-N-acetylmuramate dehydrogenase [Gammaproteobacteria bacterium]